MKKLNIKVNKTADWQKSLYLAIVISAAIFGLGAAFLFIRPLDKNIATIINDEISSTNVTFNAKTLKMLNERQQPATSTPASVGKNPFIPF